MSKDLYIAWLESLDIDSKLTEEAMEEAYIDHISSYADYVYEQERDT